MGYLSGVIAGTASYSKTLILDSSYDRWKFIVHYIDCREYRQNGTIYDLGLFEYINGVSFGTATHNKLLLCDSSSNIGGLSSVAATTLTCTNLRQDSTYYDLSSFLTSIPTSLSLNNLSTSGNISCFGVINGFLAGLDFLDGSYTRMMTLTGERVMDREHHKQRPQIWGQ
ncbi:uncharacterized protein PITG_20645 [Phytophthora infestans T30-4]|uniref:Uncharacterized protein n=1 Tax=Phytophthora infestans (strain T30-4) TaxID=403677 RepID=D0P2K1_PHYIT|nr:uncharacterized protein PITG_20645 [Phytophthora infestans T30-4]EEY56297.1 conserved hypothetical protein [Phytophthora infestans T30-4]|eukprot:XP_002895477.1 conserved hypothetical protein [Phytophthora infestans T30-4]